MPRVSAAFFAVGTLFLLSGMALGQYMGAHEDFTLAPLHAHMNLLGWVTPVLFGIFYALTKDTYSPRLAWLNFALSTLGMLGMIPVLYLILTNSDHSTTGPLAGVAGGVVILGLLVFMVSVFRELMRARTA